MKLLYHVSFRKGSTQKRFFLSLYVKIIPVSWRLEWFLLSAVVFGWNCPAKSNRVVLAVYLLFSVACFLTVHEHF